ncbi:MAG: hypothetical protein PHF99_06320 [Bacteroidales bacterium]|nr:hypothetical protein [Bacteroidales bacterium]
MNKILLEKDYQSIIIEAFKNPEIDWENYYVNIVNEHYEHNKDEFFKRLTGVIDKWLTWYKSQVYSGKCVTAKYKDGITRTVDSNTVWYYDKNDTPIFIEPDKTNIPIPYSIIGNGYNISVNREFFNNHLEIIENIKQRVKFKNDLILLEQKLPDSIKKILAKRPMAQGVFSKKDLQARFELIKELIKGQNITSNEAPKYLQELFKSLQRKTVKGFDCKQYKDRLPLIYKAMTDEKYIKTDEETFINAFSGKYFTLHSPIVWLIDNQFGHGNKLALADFLKEMLPDLAEEIHLKANRDIVSSIFIDKAGKKVIIDRRKPTETDISGYDFKPIVTGEQQKKTKFR